MASPVFDEFGRIVAVMEVEASLEAFEALLARMRDRLVTTHGFSDKTAERIVTLYCEAVWRRRASYP